MSIVRHRDKNSGTVRVYESTSHYDPVSKQSRPKRKYLGTEDPETGELIPSSGRRGRRRVKPANTGEAAKVVGPDYRRLYEECRKECSEKDAALRRLERERRELLECVRRMVGIANGVLESRECE